MNTETNASAKPMNSSNVSIQRYGRLWTVLLLGALSAFGPLSIDMYLPALPQLTADLHASTSLAQLSLTACLVGISLGQLLAGPLSDVKGRRKPLLIGLVMYAVSSLLCVVAPHIGVFVVLRLIQGIAGSAGIVISRAIVRDMYSGSELTRFYALLMLVNGVAPILAPILGGQLLQVASWRIVFVVLSAVGALMAAGVFFGLRETLPAERRLRGGIGDTLGAFRKLLADRLFIGYAFSQGLVVAAMFAYISGSPFVLQDIFGVSPQVFSLIFAINGLGIIMAGQFAGRMAGRLGELRLFAAGIGIACGCGMLLLIAIVSGAGLSFILPPLFFVVASVGLVTTAGFSLAMQNYGQMAGSASALLGLLSYVFGGTMAPLVGLGGSHTAVPMGIVIALCEACALLCYMLLARRTNNLERIKQAKRL